MHDTSGGGGLLFSFFCSGTFFSLLFIGDRGFLGPLLGELTCDYWVHYDRRRAYFRTYYTAFPDLSDIFGRRYNIGYAGHRLVHGTRTSRVFIPSLLRHGSMAWGCLQREVTLLYLFVLVLDFSLVRVVFFSLIRGGGWGSRGEGGGSRMMVLPDASLGCFFTLIFEIDSRFYLSITAVGRLSGLTTVMCLV